MKFKVDIDNFFNKVLFGLLVESVDWLIETWHSKMREFAAQIPRYEVKEVYDASFSRSFKIRSRQTRIRNFELEPGVSNWKKNSKVYYLLKMVHLKELVFIDYTHGWTFWGHDFSAVFDWVKSRQSFAVGACPLVFADLEKKEWNKQWRLFFESNKLWKNLFMRWMDDVYGIVSALFVMKNEW